MKKKIISILCVGMLLLSLNGCKSMEKEEKSAQINLQQMQEICQLATLECYYHNVAKSDTSKRVLWWNTNKKLWIEYTGIVKMGIDVSKVSMEVEDDDTVVITLPNAQILGCKVDEDSLTEDSYYIEKQGLGAGDITADIQTNAFQEAQKNMREGAENDTTQLFHARQRAKSLLESYVKNIGNVIGKDYKIEWRDYQETITEKAVDTKASQEEK